MARLTGLVVAGAVVVTACRDAPHPRHRAEAAGVAEVIEGTVDAVLTLPEDETPPGPAGEGDGGATDADDDAPDGGDCEAQPGGCDETADTGLPVCEAPEVPLQAQGPAPGDPPSIRWLGFELRTTVTPTDVGADWREGPCPDCASPAPDLVGAELAFTFYPPWQNRACVVTYDLTGAMVPIQDFGAVNGQPLWGRWRLELSEGRLTGPTPGARCPELNQLMWGTDDLRTWIESQPWKLGIGTCDPDHGIWPRMRQKLGDTVFEELFAPYLLCVYVSSPFDLGVLGEESAWVLGYEVECGEVRRSADGNVPYHDQRVPLAAVAPPLNGVYEGQDYWLFPVP